MQNPKIGTMVLEKKSPHEVVAFEECSYQHSRGTCNTCKGLVVLKNSKNETHSECRRDSGVFNLEIIKEKKDNSIVNIHEVI